MSSRLQKAKVHSKGKKIVLILGLTIIAIAVLPTGSIVCETTALGLCDLSKEARKESILRRLLGRLVKRQDLSIDPAEVATLKELFQVPSIDERSSQILPINTQAASKLTALLYSEKTLEQSISLSVPGRLDESEELIRRIPTRRVLSRSGSGGYEYVIWHGSNKSGDLTAQITASEHEGLPYLAVQVASPEHHYILYRIGDSSEYRIVQRMHSHASSPLTGGSLPSGEDLCDERPPNYLRRSSHKPIRVLAILPDKEKNFRRQLFEDFLARSIESVGSDAPLVELQYESFSASGLQDFGALDHSKLEDATSRARNVSTESRARDILDQIDMYRNIRAMRERARAHLVLIFSPYIMTSQSSSFGADDARFFAILTSESVASPAIPTHELSHLFGARHQIYNDPSVPVNNHAFVWRTKKLLLGTADSAPPPYGLLRLPLFSGSERPCKNYEVPGDVQDHLPATSSSNLTEKKRKAAWDNSATILETMKRISSGDTKHASLPEHCPAVSYPVNSDEQRCPDVDGVPIYFNQGSDSYARNEEASNHLKGVAAIVRNCGRMSSEMTVTSSGFASSEGANERNWELSYLRATKVARDIAGHFKASERPRILICPYGTLHADCYESGIADRRGRARLSIVTVAGTASCNGSIAEASTQLFLRRER